MASRPLYLDTGTVSYLNTGLVLTWIQGPLLTWIQHYRDRSTMSYMDIGTLTWIQGPCQGWSSTRHHPAIYHLNNMLEWTNTFYLCEIVSLTKKKSTVSEIICLTIPFLKAISVLFPPHLNFYLLAVLDCTGNWTDNGRKKGTGPLFCSFLDCRHAGALPHRLGTHTTLVSAQI